MNICMLDVNGLFLLDKPVGARSTDCVNKFHAALINLARAAKNSGASSSTGSDKIKIRTGHAGTLDSTASGLLILLVGRATRLSDYIMTLPKIYRATLRLGQTTDTCDYSGRVLSQYDFGELGDLSDLQIKIRELTSRLDKILPSFQGWRMQRPPEISALKLNGRPSHKLARSGQDIKLAPRPVFLRSVKRISDIKLDLAPDLALNPARSEPVAHVARIAHVDLEISCSKGTYIRSLARDIGEALGCGACIESLRRLSIGGLHVDNALSLDTFADFAAFAHDKIKNILPPREVAKNFHRILLTPEAESRLTSGVATPLIDAGKFIISDRFKPDNLDKLKPGSCVGMPSLSSDILCVEGENLIGFCDLVRPDFSHDYYSLHDTPDNANANNILLRPRANILLKLGTENLINDPDNRSF